MHSSFDPVVVIDRDRSEAWHRVIERLNATSEGSWRFSESEDEAGRRVSTITGSWAGERAILRRVAANFEPTSYEGGWFGASGKSPLAELSADEAQRLFARIYDHASKFLRRELTHVVVHDLQRIVESIPAERWEIESVASDGTKRAKAYNARLSGLIQEANSTYAFSIHAVVSDAPQDTCVKVEIERRGFRAHTYLLEARERTALDTICARLGIPPLHHAELVAPEMA